MLWEQNDILREQDIISILREQIKKIRALCDKKNNSNSCVVRKKISERNKKP